ncbi:MAG: hypothetical protein U0359_14660 [Byssovorax sp.]
MTNLRAEAQVLGWKGLTDEQRAAGKQAHDLLVAMANEPGAIDAPPLPFLPRLDKNRKSRVLLLDGGRGSGKTTLLLSVLDHWRRCFAPAAGDPLAEELSFTKGLEGRIVPVGLLDLHPLAPSTNLLMHVVGRFEQMIAWLEGDGKHDKDPPAWHLASSGILSCRKAWQKLLRAVAAAWDGGADQRRARLDLEAYALEQEESERQRLDLTSTFTEFMNALEADFRDRQRFSRGSPLLFVLALDDADMSPSRSVELLDMLRVLWHPRVAFVLTGDSALFQQTLVEHFLGEVRKPLRHHAMIAREINAIADERQVMRLASEVYEKIVPPGHRCLVEEIPAKRRLRDGKINLGDTFAGITIAEPAELTLESYFVHSPQLLEGLPDRLRGLLDLKHKIEQLPQGMSATERASRAVEAIWQNALKTSPAPIAGCGDALRVDGNTGALDLAFPWSTAGLEEQTRLVGITSAESNAPTVSILSVERFRLFPRAGSPLPRPVTAAAMLAANLVSDQEGGTWNADSSALTGNGYFAISEVTIPETGIRIPISWPAPVGYTLEFYSSLSSRWNEAVHRILGVDPSVVRGLEAKELTPENIDALAKEFLRSIASLLRSRVDARPIDTKAEWSDLAKGIARNIQRGGTRSKRWALRRAGLLAFPEYGLSEDSARGWREALISELKNLWPEVERALDSEREEAIRSALEKTATTTQTPRGIISTLSTIRGKTPLPALVEHTTTSPDRADPFASQSFRTINDSLMAAGIALNFNTQTATHLAKLSPTDANQIAKSIQPFAGISGTQTQALATLWQATVTSLQPSSEELLKLIGHTTKRIIFNNPPQIQLFHHKKLLDHTLDTGAQARVYTITTKDPSPSHPNTIKEPFRSLYKIIWDYATDEHQKDPTANTSPLPLHWPGITIETTVNKTNVEIPWRIFRWPTFALSYRSVRLWNETITRLNQASLAPSAFVNALALWIISDAASLGLSDKRQLPQLNVHAEEHQWIYSVNSFSRSIPAVSPSAWRSVCDEWITSMALFAAPESGLSNIAASGLIKSGTLQFNDAAQRTKIAQARRERIIGAGIAPADAPDILRKIDEDAAGRNHPWPEAFSK